jgi:hypothetical protein
MPLDTYLATEEREDLCETCMGIRMATGEVPSFCVECSDWEEDPDPEEDVDDSFTPLLFSLENNYLHEAVAPIFEICPEAVSISLPVIADDGITSLLARLDIKVQTEEGLRCMSEAVIASRPGLLAAIGALVMMSELDEDLEQITHAMKRQTTESFSVKIFRDFIVAHSHSPDEDIAKGLCKAGLGYREVCSVFIPTPSGHAEMASRRKLRESEDVLQELLPSSNYSAQFAGVSSAKITNSNTEQ